MTIRNLKEFKTLFFNKKGLIGLDIGDTTIGVAVSDPNFTIASPLCTINRKNIDTDMKELARIANERDISGFIIGLPINMNGTEGPRCESSKKFANQIEKRSHFFKFPPEIAFWDERLSTMAMERFLITEIDLSRKKRDKVIDKMAASYILQGAIDSLK